MACIIPADCNAFLFKGTFVEHVYVLRYRRLVYLNCWSNTENLDRLTLSDGQLNGSSVISTHELVLCATFSAIRNMRKVWTEDVMEVSLVQLQRRSYFSGYKTLSDGG